MPNWLSSGGSGGFTWASAGKTPSGTPTADVTLSSADVAGGIVTLSGAINAPFSLIIPAAYVGPLVVVNATTGGYTSSSKWRWKITADNGYGITGCTEFVMAATAGGATLCSGGTATGQGQYSTYNYSNAFDGNNTTMWIGTTSVPPILEYDFASSVTPVEYRVTTVTSSASSQSAKTWTFEYWDGAAWQVIDTRSSETGWTDASTRTYSITPAGATVKFSGGSGIVVGSGKQALLYCNGTTVTRLGPDY